MSNNKELDDMNEIIATFNEHSDNKAKPIPETLASRFVLDEVTVGYSNYEWNSSDGKNYRNEDNADLNKVLEHASRRGENLEVVVTIRFDLGHISNHPELLKNAKQVVGERTAKSKKAAELRLQAQALLDEAASL